MARTTTATTTAPAARSTAGRRLDRQAPSAREKVSPMPAVDPDFAAEWNDLDKHHRRAIRRLARLGRRQMERHDAELAVAYAEYQRSRTWYRRFWLWFVPLVVAGIVAGMALGQLVLGIVIAYAGFQWWAHRAYARVEVVNASLLAGDD